MSFAIGSGKSKEKFYYEFLGELLPDIPGVADAVNAVDKNQNPAHIINQAWIKMRAERDQELLQLNSVYSELQNIKLVIELYRTGPIAQEIQALRKSTSQLEQRAQAAERNLTAIENTTQRELDHARQEITRLQALVIEQNRTIAHQHLQLEALMGSSDDDSA